MTSVPINIKTLPEGVRVSEVAIREGQFIECEDGMYEGPLANAVLCLDPALRYSRLTCVIKFYSDDGRFLGLEESYVHPSTEVIAAADELPVIFPVRPPERTAEATFSVVQAESESWGFFSIAGRILAILLAILLVAAIFRTAGIHF